MHRPILLGAVLSAAFVGPAFSDEGGVSFWLPGMYGSFAATPTTPGWSWATLYYRSSVSAGADRQFPRGGQIDLGVDALANIGAFGPTYTFEEPFLGGQLALSLLGLGGRSEASVEATISGPDGRTISGRRSEALTGFGDLLPQATLKWNDGPNNYMAYVTGDVPVGAYDPERLANLGLGHAALDLGGGYTYFDPKRNIEASAVLGFTYNFENPDTQYQNGIDFHVDWGASRFVTKQLFVGAAGYLFQQVTGDSGAGATLGDFKSRVAGIGPQAGYLFPMGDKLQGALSAKVYWEFAAENRPEGWNAWLSFAISPKEK
ncbi:MAG: transporter [Candidatus Kaistia colombiensis]|nr:MAG: transporter [Kaistia sp.]